MPLVSFGASGSGLPSIQSASSLAAAHESVTLIKEWHDASGTLLAATPALSQTVTLSAIGPKAWLTLIYPAGDTAHPILTSAIQRPVGAGSSWPDEISATFNSATSVTANSTKDLSNVVLLFADGTVQKFDSLSGYSKTFSGTGTNAGKTILGIWLHSGNNASGDGPGYGSYIGHALMISGTTSYTVTETGLPAGWTCSSGLGTFTSAGGLDSHTVKNRMVQNLTPAINLVKTAGTAADGEVYTLGGAHIVTYTYTVSNTGFTWLKNLTVTDDKLGAIGTLAGPVAPGASVVLMTNVMVSATVTNTGTVVATPCAQTGELVSGPSQVSHTDQAVVVVTAQVAHESVAIVKEWYDADGVRMPQPPLLATGVTITASNTTAWLTLLYPAGDTAHPLITSAALKPVGAGNDWPDEVSATFNNATCTVTANSTKNLSNVVLKFADGTEQKFDNLTGYTATFSGTGGNAGKAIVGIWLHSGNNASGDGPGFGSYLGQALMIPAGAAYTVAEGGLPAGWSCAEGLGAFTSAGGSDTHTVKNRISQTLIPSVRLLKTAGTAPDGDVYTLNAAGSVTYTFLVQNTGNTWLKNLTVTDDKIGTIGTLACPLAPSASATLTKTVTVSATVTNVGSVVATPCTQAGALITGLSSVTATDNASVRLRRLSALGDFVWLDTNANGLQDAGEAGIAGVTVRLCDGSGAALGPTAVTDANGRYLFADLLPGTYAVRFAVPAGYVLSASLEGDDDTIDSDAEPSTGLTHSVLLDEGMTNLTLDAGMWQPQPAVSLVKTAGTAADGATFTIVGTASVTYTYVVKNTGNTWLKDLTVTDDKLGLVGTVDGLLGPGEMSTLTKTSIVSDNMTNVGTVFGTPSTPQGDTIPDMEDVSAKDSAVVQHLELVSLGDFVWVDANQNGIQDAGEPGLIGVSVTLLDANGATLASAITASDGHYRFSDLVPGSYRLRFTLPTAAWHFTAANQGSDSALDSDANPVSGLTPLITLASGQHDLSWDAGVYGGLPPGFCDQMTIAQDFNAIIFGDFTATGGDTEGRLAVGGTASLPPGYSVGLTVMGKVIPPVNGTADMLIVGGDLYEPGNYADINGNVVYGGTHTGVIRYNTGSNTVRRVNPVTLDANGNVPNDHSGATFADIYQHLCLASAMIASMDDRGVVSEELDKTDHIISFVGNDPVLNVFNVDASVWSGYQIDTVIDAPEYSTVVFNIHGSHVELSNGAIRLTGGVTNDRILFNYADATEITTSGYEHEGSVLAPHANGNFSGASFEGFGFFGGSVTTSTGFEFHHFPFRGTICNEAEAAPSIKLVVTAGDAADGDVLTVLGGSDVTVTYRVTNTGNTSLSQVQITDTLLGTIGTLGQRLGAGESATLTALLPNVTCETVLRGTATGRPVRDDGTLWNGYVDVSGTDDATIEVGSPSSGGQAPNTAWQRADFAVTAVEFITKPTLTGDVFSVQVTVDNHGELAADAGRLTLYLSKPDAASVGDPGDASKSVGILRPGESKTFLFNNLVASSNAGTQHLRAFVDSVDNVIEWSEGDNQLTAVYELNPIYLNIAGSSDAIELSWNSFWGQKYTLYRCTDLSKGFLLFKSHVEATPPTNTFLDVETTGMRFYRLVVEQE